MERFGEKLHTLRQRQGLTMRAPAKKLGFATHCYLGDLESGRAKPSLELALTIADFFAFRLMRWQEMKLSCQRSDKTGMLVSCITQREHLRLGAKKRQSPKACQKNEKE